MKACITACITALAIGVCIGRFTTKPVVKTVDVVKEKVVWRDREVEKKVEGPVRVQVVTRTVPGPRGPEVLVTRIVERGAVVTVKDSKHEGQASLARELKTEVLQQPSWMLGATAGLKLGDLSPVWGAQVSKRIAGPFWLGAGADSSGAFRMQLSITF